MAAGETEDKVKEGFLLAICFLVGKQSDFRDCCMGQLAG